MSVKITSEGLAQFPEPLFLTGIIVKLDGVDFCMDGATFSIHSIAGPTRLKSDNAEVSQFLAKAAGTRLRVTVGGFAVWGPECGHLNVFYAAPSHEVAAKLGLKI